MKRDSLKDFIALRQSLVTEKAALEKRLAEIQNVLDGGSATAPTAARAKRARRKRNKLSLREAIIKATSRKALTKPEILKAVEKMGYKFETKKPMNSINVVLYGKKPKFENKNGRFRPMS
jgi:hypothetical protein